MALVGAFEENCLQEGYSSYRLSVGAKTRGRSGFVNNYACTCLSSP
jgi:hypothetical protein